MTAITQPQKARIRSLLRKAEYTNATAPALPGLSKNVSRGNRESNAVKPTLHKILPSGVDGGVHT